MWEPIAQEPAKRSGQRLGWGSLRARPAFRSRLRPPQLIVLSFGSMILTSALLLWLPISSRTGESVRFVDALFTATSAVCVTGLVVFDTGTVYSTFGQMVILASIQMGALGLMSFATIFLILAHKQVRIADRIAIEESFHHEPTGKISTLLKYIVIATLATEAIGATVLTGYWWATARFETFGETVYQAVFLAVSAFCNAGFALAETNLIGFNQDPFTLFVVSMLVIAGGLGFLVGLDIKEFLDQTYMRRFWPEAARERIARMKPRPRLSVHTKFVLITTVSLLAIGTVSYFMLERDGLLAGMSTGNAWWNAWFCSVTARTAGFNAVDYTHMSGAALLCTMVLMFIGGSPGSTAGGVKTSTFGLLVAYAVTRFFGRRHLNAFGRTIPQDSRDRAGAVVIAAVVLVILGASVLIVFETWEFGHEASRREFLPIMFETVSALGTVGLTMGATFDLTDGGKLTVMLIMFLGRVGPLTLALAIRPRRQSKQYRHPEENLMVG